MRIISKFVPIAFALVYYVAPAFAATWYVKSDGSGDAPTIQAAIDSSGAGDSVLVATGTFAGPGNYDIDFQGKAIVVISEFGPTSTTVDCQSNGRGFVFQNGEGSGSVLSGFTITNGLSAVQGGAVFCDDSSPDICFNVIIGNHALGHGGGIAIKKGAPYIYNNTISENSSDQRGGGIAVQANSNPTIHQNIVSYSSLGEGVACIGASGNPTLSCNDIFGNAGGDAVCGIDAGGNASSDPRFCGIVGSGNVSLRIDSPCTPGQSACGQLVGALGINCATVPTEEHTWGAIKLLFE
jgi:hypothetical protein